MVFAYHRELFISYFITVKNEFIFSGIWPTRIMSMSLTDMANIQAINLPCIQKTKASANIKAFRPLISNRRCFSCRSSVNSGPLNCDKRLPESRD